MAYALPVVWIIWVQLNTHFNIWKNPTTEPIIRQNIRAYPMMAAMA
jgi:hypothetical protein